MVRQPILTLSPSNLILQKQIEFTCKNNMEEEKSCQDVLSLKPFGKMSCLISYKWYHMKYVGSWNIIAFFKILDSRHKNDKFVRHYIMLLQKCWTTKSQFYGSGALFYKSVKCGWKLSKMWLLLPLRLLPKEDWVQRIEGRYFGLCWVGSLVVDFQNWKIADEDEF